MVYRLKKEIEKLRAERDALRKRVADLEAMVDRMNDRADDLVAKAEPKPEGFREDPADPAAASVEIVGPVGAFDLSDVEEE